MDIIIERRGLVNMAALDAALRAALNTTVNGVSLNPSGLIVHLADSATPEQIETARTIVRDHDPAILTPDQQAEQTRRDKLETARRDYQGAELDPQDYTAESPLLRQLARKIAWLEQEIASLTAHPK